MSGWSSVLRDFLGGSGRKATIDMSMAAPPPSPLAPVDLTDPSEVAGVMEIAARIGDILLSSGTANRDARNQMHSVTTAFGLHYVHIDITKNIISLFTTIGGVRRQPVTVFWVSRGVDTNFAQLTEVDHLIRSIQSGATDPATAEKILNELRVKKPPYGAKIATLGWGVLGMGYVILLGGGLIAITLSLVLCILIMAVITYLGRNGLPVLFQQMAGGFIATLPAAMVYTFAGSLGWEILPSQVIASGIVAQVAGLSLVQSLQDGITGASVTGAARFFDTMLQTAGIVAGVAIGIQTAALMNMPLPPLETATAPNFSSALLKILGAGLLSVGLAIALYAQRPAVLLAGGSAIFGMSFYHLLFIPLGMSELAAAGLTSTIIGLTGGLLARRFLIPPTVVAVAGIIPMVPGLLLYRAMYALINEQMLVGFTNLFLALATAGSLAAGVVLGEWIARTIRRPQIFHPYGAWRRRRRM